MSPARSRMRPSPDEQKTRLEQTLSDAGVDHLIETYPARHGFAVPDLPVFDPAAAERHWVALFGAFPRDLAFERPQVKRISSVLR